MAKQPLTYAEAGVDIEAGDRMVDLIRRHMQRTFSPRVLGRHGAFAGMFRLDYNEKLFKRNYRDPVLVACTDGVGTKVLLAVEMGVHGTVGRDLVAMNVNDLLVQGAEPLFFLDYIGVNALAPERMAEIVKGVADGCQLADCSLIGGETAEMPDVYGEGEYDLAGFTVGVVELHKIVDGARVRPGDRVLGLASSGVHSNGYTLVRAVLRRAGLELGRAYEELDADRTLGQVLLEPTRIYTRSVNALLRRYRVKRVVTGMAHVTGGGIASNLERVLPSKVNARLRSGAWDRLAVFDFLQKHGDIDGGEMYRVFNMGIGFVLIVRPDFAASAARQLRAAGETVYELGQIERGTGEVVWD